MSDIPTPPPAAANTVDPAGLDDAVDAVLRGQPARKRDVADPLADAKLLERLQQHKKEALDQRWVFERVWWRNILYVLGRQWIFYDKRRNQWVDKRLAKWMPRPVTNKTAEVVEAITAMFASVRLNVLATPVGHDAKNLAAAEIADLVAPYIHESHRMDRVMRDADWWNVVLGNTFLHPYWDRTGSATPLPMEQCETCGATVPSADLADTNTCPTCGGQAFRPILDPTALPQAPTMVEGHGATDAISPLEIALPPQYTRFEQVPYLIRMRWRAKPYVEQQYPTLAKSITFSTTPTERTMQLLRSVATQSDVHAMPLTWGSGGDGEGVTEYQVWERPSRDYPEGLVFFAIGEGAGARIVHESEDNSPQGLPIRTQKGEPIFPFIHYAHRPMGGRIWARGPLDLVIQKQDQINQLDSLIQMIVQRVANPIWLEPKGAEVKSFTGEPGLVVKYSPLSLGGVVKPERLPGENVPPTLFSLREQYLKDMEELAGTYDVIKGAKPTGVEAFSALQLLVERSQSRFSPVLNERGEAYRQWYTMALELERQFGPDDRMVAITKPNRGWTFRHFATADLQGAIQIRVEDGSQAPKTALGRRAAIEQANQLGLIQPQNPEQAYAILQHFGLQDLVPSLDSDVKAALAEQDAFEAWVASPAFDPTPVMMALQQYMGQMQQYGQAMQAAGEAAAATGQPAPMLPAPSLPPGLTPFDIKPYDRHDVHAAEHRKWANSDPAREIFRTLPPLEQVFVIHLEAHREAIAREQMPPPGQPAGAGGGQAMKNSNRESGNSQDVPRGAGQRADNRGPE